MNYHILNDSMILNYDGKTLSLSSSDPRYNEVLECVRSKRLGDIKAIIEANAISGPGLSMEDGVVHIDGTAIPPELNDRILKFKEQRLPYEPLLAFWRNLKDNPSFNSRQMLYKFLEHNGHPLTEDGCFIAYRGVRDDMRDVHSGTFDNSPGQVCSMPRDAVDDNPNNTCSSGLHVACFDYAKGFGPQLVEVKVNPKDVVAVPTDYNGTKMRVCRFEVLNKVDKPRTEELVEEEDIDVTCDDDGRCSCNW